MRSRAILQAALIAAAMTAWAFYPAYAQEFPTSVSLRYQPGLMYEDGTILYESDITHYSLYCDGQHILDKANDYTYNVVVGTAELGAGTHTCGLSETVGGIESVLSNTVSFSLGQRTPTAPTLTIQ